MTEFQVCEAVAAEMNRIDPKCGAYAQDTGGGMVCVFYQRHGLHFIAGTANETWGANAYLDAEGTEPLPESGKNTEIPSESEDIDLIAINLLWRLK